MSEDSVRNATVIADEETDLLVISRELFNRSMKVQAPVFCSLRKERCTREVNAVSPQQCAIFLKRRSIPL